jgi:DNA-binding transcriptional regulator YhcF (GntR family)
MAGPLYRQIADQMRHLIEAGELKPGMQIPPKISSSRNSMPHATPSAAH